jgi:hypothetical protein
MAKKAKRKYLSSELRDIAEVLNKSGQLEQLIAHITLQSQLELEKGIAKDHPDYEVSKTVFDLIDGADQYMLDFWFGRDFFDNTHREMEKIAKKCYSKDVKELNNG